jgi:hypothetical protein
VVDALILRQSFVHPSGQPFTYEFNDPGAGTVQVFIECDGDLVRQIQAAGSFGDAIPTRMFAFCAALARELGWKVYDPQGDTWYSPSQLTTSAARRIAVDAELVRSVLTICGAITGLIGGLMWAGLGSPRGGLWFWVAATGFLAFAVARAWERMASRG